MKEEDQIFLACIASTFSKTIGLRLRMYAEEHQLLPIKGNADKIAAKEIARWIKEELPQSVKTVNLFVQAGMESRVDAFLQDEERQILERIVKQLVWIKRPPSPHDH